MGFGRKSTHVIGGGGGDGHGELTITPLLDLFVALIPFLILSMALVKIHTVDVKVSKPVAAQTEAPPDPFDLKIIITDKGASVRLNDKLVKDTPIDEQGNWINEVRTQLVDIKRQNMDQVKMRIEPSPGVKLNSLMAFMDATRELKETDGNFQKSDENGNPVKLRYLFPSVVLRGVFE